MIATRSISPSVRVRRNGFWILGLASLIGTVAATPVGRLMPGVSFRVSASTRVFAGDTPRGQDDEVMRGRGVAANNRARIEFLAFTPAPAGVTTDDFVIAGDSGKAFVLHSKDQRYTSADDVFGGPAVVALSRVMGGGGRGVFGGDPGGGPGRGTRGGFGDPDDARNEHRAVAVVAGAVA